jgi:hypothetical protein
MQAGHRVSARAAQSRPPEIIYFHLIQAFTADFPTGWFVFQNRFANIKSEREPVGRAKPLKISGKGETKSFRNSKSV